MTDPMKNWQRFRRRYELRHPIRGWRWRRYLRDFSRTDGAPQPVTRETLLAAIAALEARDKP